MIGLPHILNTKQDYINAADYVKATGDGGAILAARLRALKRSTDMLCLKDESRSKRAEKQHQEDYAPVPDPNCELLRLGFTAREIDALLGELENA